MRRIQKAFILLVILLLAGILVLECLNRTVLPGKAREWAQVSASQALGRKVSIGAVRLNLWRGFVLEKVSVAEDPRFGAAPFLEADQVSGGVLFLPLLGKRDLLIPVLHGVRPKIRLLQNPDGLWNFQTFSFQPPPAPNRKASLRINIPKVLLSDGSCEIQIARPAGLPPLRVGKVNADLRMGLPAQVQSRLTAEVLADKQPFGWFSLNGNYSLQEHRLTAESQSLWKTTPLLAFLPERKRTMVERLDGTLSLDLRASGNPREALDLQGTARTRGLLWAAAGIQGAGDLSGRFAARGDWRTLKGSIRLEGLNLSSVPRIGELRGLAGEVDFDSGGLRTEKLTVSLSNGVPVEMSGSLASDETHSFGFKAAAHFPPGMPPPLPPPWMKLLQETQFSGGISLEAIGNGALLPAFSVRPTLLAHLEGLSLQPPRAPRIEIDRGRVRWQPDLTTFTEFTGRALDQPFRLEGTLANWDQPEINASFSWGQLDGETQVSLSSEKISVESLTGRFGAGTFRAFGEIARPEMDANLFGEAEIQAEDLPEAWPASADWMKQHPVEGRVAGRWLLQGPLLRPADWDLDLHASSPALRIRGNLFRSFSAHLRQKERRVELESAHAVLAGGDLSAAGSLDRNRTPPLWKLQANLTGAQLEELARGLDWTTQGFAGQVQADWAGGGEWSRPKSIVGSGNLHVAGAQIFELPFLGQFAEFLSLPTLRTIRFQEAQGPFRIREGRVETDSLVLRSPQAALTIDGWGGFLRGVESPIQWKILPTFAPELIPEESRSRLGKAIAKGASYFVGEIHLSGTWKTPERKFISKKITQILNEQIFNLQDVLEELF